MRAPARIDCTKCLHCTSSLLRLNCAKGHVEESAYSTTRSSCVDYSERSTAQQLAKHHGSEWSGGQDIKPLQVDARRMASSLAKAAKRFQSVLSDKQTAALIEAHAVCVALGNQLEVAGRIAEKRRKDAIEARAQKRHEQRLAAIVGLGMPERWTMARRAGDFLGERGHAFLKEITGRDGAYVDRIDDEHHNALVAFARANGGSLTPRVVEALGEFIVSLKDRDLPGGWGSGTWKQFEAFAARVERERRASEVPA